HVGVITHLSSFTKNIAKDFNKGLRGKQSVNITMNTKDYAMRTSNANSLVHSSQFCTQQQLLSHALRSC
ncbi:MAG: hypothetical protein ACOVNN_07290, partial [Limnohabitans sp.]